MKKKAISILIVGLLLGTLLGLVMAQEEKSICTEVYYFIIEHTNFKNDLEYSSLELFDFSRELNQDSKETENYIINYTDICENLTHLELPKPKKAYGFLNMTETFNFTECSPYFNRTIFLWDLDSDIPLPKSWRWLVVNASCENLESLRTWWYVEKQGENYYVTGLKVWWFYYGLLLTLLIIVVVMLLKIRKKTKTKII